MEQTRSQRIYGAVVIFRRNRCAQAWVLHKRLLAYWPRWRENCTRTLFDNKYRPMGGQRYRRPMLPYNAAYFYRRGFVSGPPDKGSIFRYRLRDSGQTVSTESPK